MEKRYWLSYDISNPDTYEYLYEWLDNHEAVECGNNVASFVCDKKIKTLKEDLANNAKISDNDRIYIVFKNQDGKLKGKFLFGKRKKTSHWHGYGLLNEDIEDEDTE
ncbi:hypothetical protein QUF80_23405 [Desulfococcaceae bacterium HSG8]|nr:hypothetical protein [Desulfococcaceae bacterium HSG8]